MEITEFSNVMQILSDIRPDFVYNLAAQSFVVDSFRHPMITTQINYIGVLNILESIKVLKLDTKVFQPSTSEMLATQQSAAHSTIPDVGSAAVGNAFITTTHSTTLSRSQLSSGIGKGWAMRMCDNFNIKIEGKFE